ncbi:MAG: ABC transporter permease subunit [Arenicellales bacterium]|nr:ABC transporter permease subunit [Arenicellales bacterium]
MHSTPATIAMPVETSGNFLGYLWRNQESRAVIIQVVTIAALFALIAMIARNVAINLEAIGKEFSFDFLWATSAYDITFSPFIEYSSRDTHLRAAVVGILNTLLIAGCGIVLATILGFLMGIMRLSSNWLVSRIVYCIIEFTRNVPVLLHILLIHGIIVTSLPAPKQAIPIGESIFISNRGFFVPSPVFEEGFWLVVAAFLTSVVAVVFFRRWAKKVQDATGKIYPVFWISLGIIVGSTSTVFIATGMPLSWDIPELKGFNYKGGMSLKPEFLALWLALSYYTASFIAEIVRGGILAVSHGQTEAAQALGLRQNRVLQLVIIPQALRVIVPPLASQYLNLTKDSSLAIAVGYMDVVATIGGISLMQTGKEMETMIIVMGIYLTLSLTISTFMNWFNRRMALVTR